MNLERWADRLISQLNADVRVRIALDPEIAMREDLRLTVERAPQLAGARADGGSCDGMSYTEDRVVLFAPSPYSKRQNFTLVHELAHMLIENDERTLDWAADQDDAAKVIESLCDAVAQRLLLPTDLIDSVISTPMRAQDIPNLSDASAASNPVAAIALASRFRNLGAAIIVDRLTWEVTSASIHPDPERGWPKVFPWTGNIIPAGHALRDVNDTHPITRRSSWRMDWGTKADFYIDAIADDRRVYALLSAMDVWNIEAMPVLDDRDYDLRMRATVFHCGQTRPVRGFPCSKCGKFTCPNCGNCDCTAVRRGEAECESCHSLVASHLLTDGICELCA